MSEENKKDQKEDIKSQINNLKGKISNKKPKNPFNLYWIYGLIVLVFLAIQFSSFNGAIKEISEGEFLDNMLAKKEVEKVIIVRNELKAEIFIKQEALTQNERYNDVIDNKIGGNTNRGPHYQIKIGSIDNFVSEIKEYQADFEDAEKIRITYDDRKNWVGDALSWILPIVLMIGLWMFLMRRMSGPGGPGGQIFNFGKSKATLFDQNNNVQVTFKDVAGLQGAKEEVMEVVDFLKNPKKYTVLGAKIPKGALLVGPPGTGKTLLAKAVAGEAKVPFFSLSGSDFVEMFVGVGASRVRDLFKQAKEKAPCIIFIDEIDAIGRARGKNPMQGSNDERENTLNQLLTEMDGFGTNSGIIILAATNRADVLDSALMRAGRFDRQIYVDMPDLNERQDIFKVHIKPLKLDDSVDVEFLARQTPGFSGADIANLCNEAALIAARTSKEKIGKQDFLDAVDRIVGGLEKKNKIISPQEKKVIAYHEAGHATVSWLLEHASPLVKVTIVPRGKSLGAAWYLPEERQITTTEQLTDEMCAALGGRAAEEIIFGKISTGALSDLEKITKQAYAMVSVYGLNEKVGNISFYDSSGRQDYSFNKPYSEKTAQLIDDEVKLMVENAYNATKKLLIDNKDKLQKLAELLLSKEVIFKEDLEEIFGKRNFGNVVDVEPIKEENIVEETIETTVNKKEVSSENEQESSEVVTESKTDEEEEKTSN